MGVEEFFNGPVREDLLQLLEEIYHFQCFRDLTVYRDLFVGKEKCTLGQGNIMERVILEAEKGLEAKETVRNVLVTAPTGAGKSILFQLPAIYLGRKYGALTLVVSPLKALIMDQVDNLHELGYQRVDFVSSDLSPEQRTEVYKQVRQGEIDLFYLSPELLLHYDIRHLIGDRRIGMIVVDEAHTVTTWGKEFRVDYWFLGRYLQGLKQSLGYSFPVFALTATAVWNPKGGNDMVWDTVRSLHMEPCCLCVGSVKRENIGFDIRQMQIEEGETYEKAKQRIVSARIEEFLQGHKTLLYYPFAGGIDKRLIQWVKPGLYGKVASYYGQKDKNQKSAIIQAFKEGSKQLIFATKAFGMGVDIADIDRIYHVAPSSTFVDYIQEVGRAARDASVYGVAATDFHERDFYYMMRLHQTRLMQHEQLEQILKKLCEVYEQKGCSGKVTISLTDFEYVLRIPHCRNKIEYESELEQQVKSALLFLEEDLNTRSGKMVMRVLPRYLLSEGYVQDKVGDTFVQTFADYITVVPGEECVYKVRLGDLWEERFPDLGYLDFKQRLNGGLLCEGSRAVLVAKHEVCLEQDAAMLRQRLVDLLSQLKVMMKRALDKNKGKFEEEELRTVFAEQGMDVRSAKHFLNLLLESRVEEGRSVNYITSVKKVDGNELVFTVVRGFDRLFDRYVKLFDQRIKGGIGTRLTFYCTPFSDLNMLLNLLSILGGLWFSVEGGGIPCVDVQFSDKPCLKEWFQEGTYQNIVLERNEHVFEEQIKLFRYFFGTAHLTNEERWQWVEDYFTGMSVEELIR